MRDLFLSLGEEHGYTVLAERPMVLPDGETFFVVAAVAAHLQLFAPDFHTQPARYITTQRVFSGTRLGDVGRYPLATPFEVMLSIFRFGDDDALSALSFIQRFLTHAIRAEPSHMLYLAPHELRLRESVLSMGVPQEQVLSWERSIPLRLGKGRPQGHYVKMFLPYRHGLMPVATLGLMELDGKLAVDSALFLERLTFMHAGYRHWYESPLFKPLVEAVQAMPILASLSPEEHYLWANHLRSLVALLWDGTQPNGKGPGHMLRKMARQLAGTMHGERMSPDMAEQLVDAATHCLHVVGYDLAPGRHRIAAAIQKLLNDASIQIAQMVAAFTARLEVGGPLTAAEVETWRSERGLQAEWMERIARHAGHVLPIAATESRFWLRNACYSFDAADTVDDPIGFLRAAEEQRMKGGAL